ncbi:zinc knuckle (CCHC-type) family protein [Striga asiatica]|uniref:Zinc knuckle (CCHC-type) family protein n=1 Tax=Striga asiatica TaxID=4170 RepID=A0A5A7RH90_STRAF|nr:zinc knuckle (CCHC-type) family protein [Striga asiatica]
MRIGDGHTGGGRDSHVSSHVTGFSPQMSGSKPDHPGSGGVPNSGGGRQRVCYNCGKSGHLAASCFEVLGYPDWYPRGGAGRRGGRRGRGGRGGGAPAQANGKGGKAFEKVLHEHIVPWLTVVDDLKTNVVVRVDKFVEKRELLFSFQEQETCADDWYFKYKQLFECRNGKRDSANPFVDICDEILKWSPFPERQPFHNLYLDS